MKSMVFEDSVFEECYFEDITSTNTFFRNCTFIASLFYNTGKYKSFVTRVICIQEVDGYGETPAIAERPPIAPRKFI